MAKFVTPPEGAALPVYSLATNYTEQVMALCTLIQDMIQVTETDARACAKRAPKFPIIWD